MPSGRKTQHAQAIGCDAELLCAAAHETNGALGVADLDWVVIFRPEPIFENKRGNAERVQPVRHLSPFMIHRQVRVGTARRDNYRSANTGPVCPVQRDRRFVFIALAERSRRALFPQWNRLRLSHVTNLSKAHHRQQQEKNNHPHEALLWLRRTSSRMHGRVSRLLHTTKRQTHENREGRLTAGQRCRSARHHGAGPMRRQRAQATPRISIRFHAIWSGTNSTI